MKKYIIGFGYAITPACIIWILNYNGIFLGVPLAASFGAIGGVFGMRRILYK